MSLNFGSAFDPSAPPTLEDLLEQARRRVEVTNEELVEARRRRDLIAAALRKEFPGSRIYINGSVAHGDALDPLTDIDLGVVVAEAVDTHGPGKKGCSDLQERAHDAIRAELGDEFPELRVEWRDRKRSVLVRFKQPVKPDTGDFTADVIVAIDNVDEAGLFIPNYLGWDKSHPEEHTRLVKDANDKSRRTYARVVRLLKHWNRSNQRPLASWNIKALGLDVFTAPGKLLDGLVEWFDHAIKSLSEGLTEDPAGVAEKPISINLNMTRTEVVNRLKDARGKLEKAIDLEQHGYPLQAHEQLAKFFNDAEMMPFPDENAVAAEVARKHAADREKYKSIGAITTAPVVGATKNPVPASRSWSNGFRA